MDILNVRKSLALPITCVKQSWTYGQRRDVENSDRGKGRIEMVDFHLKDWDCCHRGLCPSYPFLPKKTERQ